jgi:WD40 repeat protein
MLACAGADGTIRLWTPEDDGVVRPLEGHTALLSALAFSPDGAMLASASADGVVKLWVVATGEVLYTLNGPTSWVPALAFSRDGQTLAIASDHKAAQLWSVVSGELVHTLTGHMSRVTSVVFSPDSVTLASGGWDNTTGTWETTSGVLRLRLALLPNNEWLAYHPQKRVYNASPQGDTYAAVRFGNQFRPVYPLHRYRKELKRTDLVEALQAPQPTIKPPS